MGGAGGGVRKLINTDLFVFVRISLHSGYSTTDFCQIILYYPFAPVCCDRDANTICPKKVLCLGKQTPSWLPVSRNPCAAQGVAG